MLALPTDDSSGGSDMEIGEDELDDEPPCNQQQSQLSSDDEASVFSPLSDSCLSEETSSEDDSNSCPRSTPDINDEGTQQPQNLFWSIWIHSSW